VDPEFMKTMGLSVDQISKAQIMKGTGCRTCNNTGYKGRVALYEVMRFNDALKDMVLQGGSTAELKAAAIRAGMVTLRASGLLKVLAGVTTLEEVGRVTMAD
jgi:type IV pilus assembly protein PilB